MPAAHNPLLHLDDRPDFPAVLPAHIEPAITALIDQAQAALEQVAAPDFAPDWDAMASVLGVAVERLSRAWGVVGHLKSVCDSAEWRAVVHVVLPRITEFFARLASDTRLYAKYQAIPQEGLGRETLRALRNALRDFVLGGAQLQGEERERFLQLQECMAQASQTFSENVLDATEAFAYFATEDEVAGLPTDVIAQAREQAQAEGQPGYKLTLKAPCYMPVMQFAHSRSLRERLYRAYTTRASEQAAEAGCRWDNTPVIADLLRLRQEEARLLRYSSFAEVSLVPKMADSPQDVLAFLRDLARKARPYARRDVRALRQFAAQQLGCDHPEAWDWTYLGERLRQSRYAYSEQEVKPYFPLPRVLDGLFGLARALFDIGIEPHDAPVWHEDVRCFRVSRLATDTSPATELGRFYLDTTARNGKRGGAWMDEYQNRWFRADRQQLPIAYLVCNFSTGADGKPALLTHEDVLTLFHEFGHTLHHLLTQVDEVEVAGIQGVEWDAVELPSQFLEHFGWEWNVLSRMSAHVDTGEPLPRTLFDKMVAARHFHSGLQLLRQVEYALFDMLLHAQTPPPAEVQALLQQVRDEVAVLPSPPWARPAHTFSHIFSGGYSAGYYSYLWAEVLSSDAYAAFEETASPDGELDRRTGLRFRQEILEVGGSRPAMESFQAFRGRAPRIDALLRHRGLGNKEYKE
ncbi:M3 family metallopeptidase [Candidatus Symbiobacter mobilis]|uniref:oligopeptidase A n=1 Tax=Candidatus Symbiobacter mobilis CR TaxID=946483 RepID=U5NCV5_9BURK|nr:M3 family metallopeptidase [Candidatus Symbiobacter mobilis]AGX87999.1 oligopeptidase A [Candidatus Symbiobacter mobilis CR]